MLLMFATLNLLMSKFTMPLLGFGKTMFSAYANVMVFFTAMMRYLCSCPSKST